MSDLPQERMLRPDEETALLPTPLKITPLPKLQYSVLLMMMLSEPIAFTSINPYIKELIASLDVAGGDERRVGYYAGLLMSLFFAGETLTTFQWAKLSDRIGRKPILLTGLTGLSLTMLLFGISRNFTLLVACRFFTGMLNGNSGLYKTMFAEITDSSNRVQAFGLIPAIFSIGVAVGPFIGGSLEHPGTKYPNLFPQAYWHEFPYFLPCAVVAAIAALNVAIGVIWLKETLPSKSPTGERPETSTDEEPMPLKLMRHFPVMVSLSNYCLVSFIAIVHIVLLPIFYASSIENGGLSLSPSTIGSLLGTWGLLNGFFQFFLFTSTIKRLGERTLFVTSVACFIPVFALYPITNLLAARTGDVSPYVWAAIVIQLLLMFIADMSFGAVFMFIIAASPNRRSLGATNGLAQSLTSIVRACGPAIGAGLLSVSTEHGIMGGYGVYFVMISLAAAACGVGMKLPKRPWKNKH